MSRYELVIPDHLSRSQVDTYADCGRKWLLERGLQVPRIPAWALLGGSAVHAATEQYDRALLEGNDLDDEVLREAFHLDFQSRIKAEEELYALHRSAFKASGRASKAWPNKEDEAWWTENGPIMCLRWKSWRRVTPWELVPVVNLATGEYIDPIEWSYKLDLGEAGETWGAVDRIFTYQDQLLIVDLKTGANAPKKPDQLGDYATAVEQAVGRRPAYGFFWMARDGGVLEAEDLSKPRMLKPGMERLYGDVKRGIEAGLFIPNVGMLCGYCGVREFCSAVDGPNSSQVEV